MSTADAFNPSSSFQDRRQSSLPPVGGFDRRQFGNTYDDLSAEARELALAIDAYKLKKGRRFINFDEMLEVIQSLGYHRD
jgi:hypothetical protein